MSKACLKVAAPCGNAGLLTPGFEPGPPLSDRRRDVIFTLAFALAIGAATPVDGQAGGFDEIWAESGTHLEAEGVDRPMARAAYLWTELQYHMGLCSRFVSEGDLNHWRFWWRNSPLENGPYGRMILRVGEESFLEGIADARSRPLDAVQCQRVYNSWDADMRQVLSEAPRAPQPRVRPQPEPPERAATVRPTVKPQ